jgi:protein SCO1/2
MLKRIFRLLFLSLLLNSICVFASTDHIEVGIDEKLGDYLPLDAQFVNSLGDTVLLGDILKKPTLLSIVYYECPGICAPLLAELGWILGKVELKPVEDFQIITLSMDHTETHEIAHRWKKNYFDGLKKKEDQNAWTFLTGDSANVYKVTNALGFYFKKEGKDFTHPGAIMAISPKGKISRYLLGVQFNPFDVKMALLDAESGKTNPTVAKVLKFCFSYDPDGRKYSLNVTRISGVIVFISLGIFLFGVVLKKKKVVS